MAVRVGNPGGLLGIVGAGCRGGVADNPYGQAEVPGGILSHPIRWGQGPASPQTESGKIPGREVESG